MNSYYTTANLNTKAHGSSLICNGNSVTCRHQAVAGVGTSNLTNRDHRYAAKQACTCHGGPYIGRTSCHSYMVKKDNRNMHITIVSNSSKYSDQQSSIYLYASTLNLHACVHYNHPHCINHHRPPLFIQ